MDVYKHIVKRILSMTLMFALVMGSLGIPVYAQEQNILYEADFEDKNAGDPLDDWIPNRSGASIGVTDDNGNFGIYVYNKSDISLLLRAERTRA